MRRARPRRGGCGPVARPADLRRRAQRRPAGAVGRSARRALRVRRAGNRSGRLVIGARPGQRRRRDLATWIREQAATRDVEAIARLGRPAAREPAAEPPPAVADRRGLRRPRHRHRPRHPHRHRHRQPPTRDGTAGAGALRAWSARMVAQGTDQEAPLLSRARELRERIENPGRVPGAGRNRRARYAGRRAWSAGPARHRTGVAGARRAGVLDRPGAPRRSRGRGSHARRRGTDRRTGTDRRRRPSTRRRGAGGRPGRARHGRNREPLSDVTGGRRSSRRRGRAAPRADRRAVRDGLGLGVPDPRARDCGRRGGVRAEVQRRGRIDQRGRMPTKRLDSGIADAERSDRAHGSTPARSPGPPRCAGDRTDSHDSDQVAGPRTAN